MTSGSYGSKALAEAKESGKGASASPLVVARPFPLTPLLKPAAGTELRGAFRWWVTVLLAFDGVELLHCLNVVVPPLRLEAVSPNPQVVVPAIRPIVGVLALSFGPRVLEDDKVIFALVCKTPHVIF